MTVLLFDIFIKTWMNVPKDWTTVAAILNVLTRMEVFPAHAIMVILVMAYLVLVSSTLKHIHV